MRMFLLIIGLILLYLKGAVTLLIIDFVVGTQWFSWVNSLLVLILQILWMRARD